MGEDIQYEALGHYAAHLAAASAHAEATGAVVTTAEFVGTVMLPTVSLLRHLGWHCASSQELERFAVLAQAAHRLRPTPGQWRENVVVRYCN